MSDTMKIKAAKTALLLLDIQNFSINAPTVPHSGREIAANAGMLAAACRQNGILVVRVRVGTDAALRLAPLADAAMEVPAFDFSPGCFDFPASLGPIDGDVIVNKHNWGALYGTDLNLQLRRRGIDTLIICGIATNYAVEATVRQAHERAYTQVIISDAAGAFSAEEHDYPFKFIFPHIARIRTTAEMIEAVRTAPAAVSSG